ncbi:Holliday junction resolvase RecU [Priestia aryabhattai]|uniref:Holliday junction resolvase RecU n=1 Tax=Priestia aryabhattai TaxID=412384 RepID=UPI003C8AA1FD
MARKYSKKSSHANRGRELETYLEQAIERYSNLEIAEIERIATPIRVQKVDAKTGNITSAFFEKKSTVDFLGVCNNGRFVAFDAKETEDLKKFPLGNLNEHQLIKLKRYATLGGTSFLIVHFVKHHETYIIKLLDLLMWWEDKKSIPYEFFKTKCIKCGPGRNLPIDFLSSLGI